MKDTNDPVEVMNAAGRRRGFWYIAVALAFALLTVGIFFAIRAADSASDDVAQIKTESVEREVRVENLEKALDAQRAQFEACKDKKRNAPGCTKAVAPSSGNVGPQGVPGLQGIPGPAGPAGPQGPQGIQGVPGIDGRNGADGKDGLNGETGASGEPGATGATGATGPAGPVGPAGPKGDTGEPGPKGDTGEPGPAGPAGYPDSFAYEDVAGRLHTCTDPDGDHVYICD